MAARDTSDAPGAAARADEAEASLLRSLKGIGTFVAPTSLLTALLFYFGWVFTDAQSRYLGLDVSLLGFSTRDYLLRSLTPAFLPLIGLLVGALAFQSAHRAIVRWIDRGLPPIFLAGLAGTAAVLLTVSVVSAFTRNDGGNNSLTPLGVTLGLALLSYSAALAAARRRWAEKRAPMATTGQAARRVIILLLLAVCLFWEVSYYARDRGRRAGEDVIESLACLPDAIVYSERPLFLAGPGASEEVLGDPAKAEAFRYRGLKLLLHGNGRHFLLPAGWSLEDARTIVLPDDAVQRLELVRPC